MKKLWVCIASALLAAVLFAVSSCGLFDVLEPDANYPSDVAVSRGEAGSAESFLASGTTPSTQLRRAFEEAREDGYDGSFYDFLEGLGLSDDGAYLQRAYASSVSVYAIFSSASSAIEGYTSMGSGVIYALNADMGTAFIVTNYHVVYSVASKGNETVPHVSDDIRVVLYGESRSSRAMSASYVGGVMKYDIAVLSVTNDILSEGFARELVGADSDSISAGERVYAVGNADGKGMSVTEGIVSVPMEYVNIYASDEKTMLSLPEIRTDADVNHGNSGGGLFNKMGELVGIVNARSEEEGVEGFGYALPANLVLGLVQNILDTCAANPSARGAAVAFMGVTVASGGTRSVFDEETGKVYIEEKTVLQSIEYGSLADKAGLREADTLLSLRLISADGITVRETAVTNMERLTDFLLWVRLGDSLELTVSRSGEEDPVAVTIDYSKKNNFRAFS